VFLLHLRFLAGAGAFLPEVLALQPAPLTEKIPFILFFVSIYKFYLIWRLICIEVMVITGTVACGGCAGPGVGATPALVLLPVLALPLMLIPLLALAALLLHFAGVPL